MVQFEAGNKPPDGLAAHSWSTPSSSVVEKASIEELNAMLCAHQLRFGTLVLKNTGSSIESRTGEPATSNVAPTPQKADGRAQMSKAQLKEGKECEVFQEIDDSSSVRKPPRKKRRLSAASKGPADDKGNQKEEKLSSPKRKRKARTRTPTSTSSPSSPSSSESTS